MKTIIELISNEVMTAFKEAGYDENMGKVTLSNRPDLCEYQCNGAMAGAKVYHKAPIMIANDVVAKLADSKVLEMAEAVNPGFINLKVSGAYMAQYLEEMRNSEKMGVEEAKDPQTMILDYGVAPRRCLQEKTEPESATTSVVRWIARWKRVVTLRRALPWMNV